MATTGPKVGIDEKVEQVGQEVEARPVYRGAIAVGLVAFGAFALVSVLVVTGASTYVDNAILSTLHQLATPAVVETALLLTMLGNEALWLFLPLSVLILWLRGLKWQAAELIVAFGGAQIANDMLKLAFHRDRPSGYSIVTSVPGQAYSFPSGHAMVSIAFYGALAYIGWRILRGRLRTAWIRLMVAVVVLVGFTRLLLAAHYPTDVLASWALGLVWLDMTLVALGYLHQRRSARTTPVERAPAAP